MTELKTKVEDVSPVKKKIEVTIPLERVKKVLEAEYKKIGKTAKLKGFRKGKVPKNLVEKYYAEDVRRGVMDTLVRESYPEALDKEMAMPISAPYVEPGVFDKEAPFTYSAVFEIRPVVEPKGYDGLKLEKLEIKVEKEEVDKQLEMVRQQMTQLEPLPDDAKSEKDVVMMIDFEGSVDGKTFEGGSAKDFAVEIGAGSLLPELEKEMIGLKKGEEKNFDIDYPADYFNQELAGKKGSFHINVKELKRKIIPELNDEFAKDLGNFKTLEEVKKDIEKRIKDAKEQDAKRGLTVQVLEKLAESHPFEIPESMIHSELKAMFESFAMHLKSEGKKFEDTGMTIDQFVLKYKKDAENRVRSFLVVDSIAEIEKIEVTEEEVEEGLKIIAQQSGQPLPKVKQYYEKENSIAGLKIQLRHDKTIDFVIDKAKIKVTKPEKPKKPSK